MWNVAGTYIEPCWMVLILSHWGDVYVAAQVIVLIMEAQVGDVRIVKNCGERHPRWEDVHQVCTEFMVHDRFAMIRSVIKRD